MQKKLEARKQTYKFVKILIFIFSIETLYVIGGIYYVLFIQGDKTPFEEQFIENFDTVKSDLKVVKDLLKYLFYIYVLFVTFYIYKIFINFYKLSKSYNESYKPRLIKFVQTLEEYILLSIFIGSFSMVIGGFELYYTAILSEKNIMWFLLKIIGLFVGAFFSGFLIYGFSYIVIYGIPYRLLQKKIKKYYVQV
ncbi:hypothetical protein UJ101_01874 [Flavobacteriaceae bacterium UJ101]|nr:hypothetical protein UJ101_01874 [Flavobacteriaceae bacterium UJ101]